MKAISLFSGCGGMDRAFDRAGIPSVLQCEIDKDCNTILARHWPQTERATDVRELDGANLFQVLNNQATGELSPSTERAAGQACVVPPLLQRVGEGNEKQAILSRTETPMESNYPLSDDARTVECDEEGATRTLRPLSAAVEGDANRPRPHDGQGAGAALSRLQYQTGSDREPDVSTGSTSVSGAAPDIVIHGGFPCQDVSLAGKRAGLIGERSGLFFEVMRIIKEMREASNGISPTFAVIENVPGLLSSNGGRDFAVVLRELALCGAMDVAWRILDAQWFGLAQRRRRVFVVADFRGRRAGEILFEREGGPRHHSPRRGTGKEIAGSLGGGAYGSGRRSEHDPNLVMSIMERGESDGRRRLDTSEELAYALTGQNRYGGVRQTVLAPSYAVSLGQTGANGRRWNEDVAFTLDKTRQAVAAPIAGPHHRQDLDHETYIPEVAYTVRARDGKGIGFGVGEDNLVAQQWRVRRLTPLECERLQGLPDGWTSGLSDSARYRMLGNSVAVPVVEWIARRMKAAGE